MKSPKLYLRDTGLLCFLLNVRSADELRESPLRGAIFETATYAELRKRLARTDEVASLFYYRDRATEVDFVIHRGGRFSLLECKWTELPDERDVAGLRRLAEEFSPERILDRRLVCRASAPYALGGARVVPLDALDGP